VIDYYRLAGPALRLLDPETAHRWAVRSLKYGLVPQADAGAPASLAQEVWGLSFPNPVGLAAGFDKNGECVDGMLGQGFGFVEVGSVTPRPQPGNPRPRMFRLIEDRAVINRMGFNNQGIESVAERLLRRQSRGGIVGVNLGKNKDTVDAAADYEKGVKAFASIASYLVINVSSPNTPGLRALQGRAQLTELVARTKAALSATGVKRPLLLKIAPDLTGQDEEDIAEVALSAGLDGLIVSNTTIARSADLASRHAGEAGGLSGRPLFEASTALLGRIHRLTAGRLPIVGVGGIASGQDAYAKIRAGASLVQLYSALAYDGPALVGRIKRELADLLAREGFTNIREAVGADHR
jgi:dihydroorotate dehydrogenase